VIEYEDLVGKPFELGARGHDKYDCYGLVMELLRRQGINPEDYGHHSDSQMVEMMMISAEKTVYWQKVDLQEGSLLLFRIGRFIRHVGFYIGNNKFIHCWEGSSGVVIESLSIDWVNRLIGCYKYVQK
jgi:cell wall-associated NlpC family hydrolase